METILFEDGTARIYPAGHAPLSVVRQACAVVRGQHCAKHRYADPRGQWVLVPAVTFVEVFRAVPYWTVVNELAGRPAVADWWGRLIRRGSPVLIPRNALPELVELCGTATPALQAWLWEQAACP